VKPPICLLIGRGSRVGPILKQYKKGGSSFQIVCVISHKALETNSSGEKIDVPGIALAKSAGIRTEYFNLVQMREASREASENSNKKFSEKKFRRDYFRILGAFICQKYPLRPVAVFMQGWDLVVSDEFLRYFPGPGKGVYNVINFHPSLLPEKKGQKGVSLSDGRKIPVLKGEHDEVLEKALKLKLPAIGITMHYTQVEFDVGGLNIAKVEVPILTGDNFESLEKRHRKIESAFMVEAIEKWAKK